MTDKPAAPQENNEAQFMIQRIYVKDSSFEAPGTPAVFQQDWQPELALELNFENKLFACNKKRVSALLKSNMFCR